MCQLINSTVLFSDQFFFLLCFVFVSFILLFICLVSSPCAREFLSHKRFLAVVFTLILLNNHCTTHTNNILPFTHFACKEKTQQKKYCPFWSQQNIIHKKKYFKNKQQTKRQQQQLSTRTTKLIFLPLFQFSIGG